jgi:lipoprotein NlpD
MRRGLALIVVAVLALAMAACGSNRSLAPVSSSGKYSKKPGKTSHAHSHTVRKGDTLFSIAFQHGKDYRSVARWNGIKRPYTIYIGQKLRLTPPKKTSKAKKPTKKPAKTAKSTNKTSKTVKKPKNTAKKTTRPTKKTVSRGPVAWRWPSRGKIIQTYLKKDPTRKGIEIAGRQGQPVVAAADGKIVYSGSGLRGYGRLIIVKHNERFLSAYAHNRKLLVKEGSQVKQGQRIAEMGQSGTDKVKLHFEIRRDGKPVDPQRYLPKR